MDSIYGDPKLREPSMNLADIERKLQELAMQRSWLLSELACLKTQANKEHSPIISKLPTEIMQMIFFSCLPDITHEDLLEDNRDEMKNPTAPLMLGHICRTWREIAWEMPELWHKITLYMFPRNQSLQGEMVEEWLTRTAKRPLDITIYSYASKAAKNARPQKGYNFLFIRRLEEHSRRWRSLHLRVPRDSLPDFSRIRLNCGRCGFLSPILEELVVEAFRVESSSSTYLELRHLATHLKIIELEEYPELKSIVNSWGKLTSFSMREMTVEELREVLSKASNLTDCKVSRITPSPDLGSQNLVHDKLRRLEIQNDACQEGKSVASFLGHISLPGLEELAATLSHFIDAYRLFFQRSGCTLRKMRVYFSHHVSQSSIIELLSATPLLEALYIRVRPDNIWLVKTIGNKLLRLLSRPGSAYEDVSTRFDDDTEPAGGEEVPLVPHLQDLELHGPINFNWKVLCNFLESRCHTFNANPKDDSITEGSAFRTLRSITVTVRGLNPFPGFYLSDEIISCLKKLKTEGLSLRVEYPEDDGKSTKFPAMVDLIEKSATHCDTVRYLESLLTDSEDEL